MERGFGSNRGRVRLAALIMVAFMFAGQTFADGRPSKVIGNPIYDPTYGDGGGGSGGGLCYYACALNSDGWTVSCQGVPRHAQPWGGYGYTNCTAYNVPQGQQGPNGCVFSGSACALDFGPGATSPRAFEELASEIVSAFIAAKPFSLEDAANFLGDVEQAIALDPDASRAAASRYQAYRAKWNELVPTMPLNDGDVPIIPRARTVRHIGQP